MSSCATEAVETKPAEPTVHEEQPLVALTTKAAEKVREIRDAEKI